MDDGGAPLSVWVELAPVIEAAPVSADVRNVESARLALAGVGVGVAVAVVASVSVSVSPTVTDTALSTEERMLPTTEVTARALSIREAIVATVAADASFHLRVLRVRLEAIKKREDADVSAVLSLLFKAGHDGNASHIMHIVVRFKNFCWITCT